METILSIIAIIFSLISGAFTCYTFYWTAKRDRRQATLEAYNRLQNEVFDKLNPYRPEEIQEICKDKRSETYKEISGYLARIEHFCVGINENIYDKETFYALAHGYFDGPQLRRRIDPLLTAKNGNSTARLFYNDTQSVMDWMDRKAARNEH